MKTLVVKYLPRGERSHTKNLLDAFLQEAKPAEPETLDLVEEMPDLFLPHRLQAYVQRDYLGEELDEAGRQALASMDRMVAQVQAADLVVLATPMHNFSLPAIVKAWFDAVMLKNHTWTIGDKGYAGLLQGKRAISLSACGGIYEGETAGYDLLRPLIRTEFGFMGFNPVDTVVAQGMNAGEEQARAGMDKALAEIRELVAAL